MGLMLIAFASAAQSAVPSAAADVLTGAQRDWLTQRGQLRVGLVLQAPYAQFDRRAQVLSGANVDLVNLMAKTLQVELLWRNFADQPELEKALAEGQIDFAPGLTQTPAGLRAWLYSDPYMRVPQLLVGERDGAGAVDLDKLDSQVRVAVRMPSATADYLRSNYTHLNVQGVPLERRHCSYCSVSRRAMRWSTRRSSVACPAKANLPGWRWWGISAFRSCSESPPVAIRPYWPKLSARPWARLHRRIWINCMRNGCKPNTRKSASPRGCGKTYRCCCWCWCWPARLLCSGSASSSRCWSATCWRRVRISPGVWPARSRCVWRSSLSTKAQWASFGSTGTATYAMPTRPPKACLVTRRGEWWTGR